MWTVSLRFEILWGRFRGRPITSMVSDVRVLKLKVTTGDNAVALLDEAVPCGCTLFDIFTSVWVHEGHYSWLSMYEFKVLRLIHISGKLC